MNWDSPEARLQLIEAVGVKEYNRLLAEHMSKRPSIYKVQSRFGTLYAVKGTRMAFRTLAEAEAYQNGG